MISKPVVAIARCKNEQDIVEQWARHTLWHVDRIVIQDNSEDGTLEILHELIDEGWPITVIDETKMVGDYQATNATMLMHEIGRDADWVVPLDVDEFVRSATPLKDVLAHAPRTILSYLWTHYVWQDPVPGMESVSPWQAPHHFPNRLVSEWSTYPKIALPSELARTVTLSKGAHFSPGYSALPLPDVQLAHFPVRSAEQWALKSLIHDFQERAVMNPHNPNLLGANGHPAIQEVYRTGRVSADTLAFFSRRYSQVPPADWPAAVVHDPLVYRGEDVLFARPVQLLPTLVRFVEKMARQLAYERAAKVA